jgi:two-component system, LytTR family, sensor kinase
MHNAKFFIKYKLHHLIIWMLVFGVWYNLRYMDYSSQEKAFKITLLKVADLALMIYTANFLLVPHLLYRKKYFLFGLSYVAMILLSSYGKMQIIGSILGNPDLFSINSSNFKTRIYDNIIPHFFLVTAGVSVKLVIDFIQSQQRLADMAKEKAETELNFLKSQINPHFLFNSINSVYFLIDKENVAARNALHKFSEMLRYQLYECNGEKIPVEKEISFLKDYVDLQKLRTDEKYSVEFNCAPDVKGFTIEPILLIPLVENSFKHISHFRDNRQNEIKIDISRLNGEMIFSVFNSTENGEAQMKEQGGIGLANVKRRLELLYPGRHILEVKKKNESFDVKLRLGIES